MGKADEDSVAGDVEKVSVMQMIDELEDSESEAAGAGRLSF